MSKILEIQLQCGGKLCILQERWYLEFSTQELDQRYRKRKVQIKEEELSEYCQNLKENFERYEMLKKQGNLSQVRGKGGMWIRFGFREGVCLYEQSYPVRRKKEVDEILKELESIPEIVKRIWGAHFSI